MMTKTQPLTAERLRALLDYAGHVEKNGYRRIMIDRRRYYVRGTR